MLISEWSSDGCSSDLLVKACVWRKNQSLHCITVSETGLDSRLPTPASLIAAEIGQPVLHRDCGVKSASRESLSTAIAIARVICISGIVYVHAWTGLNIDELRAQGGSWQSALYWMLIEFQIGRASCRGRVLRYVKI